MSDVTEKFRRFQQEHSRLHDPEMLHSSLELIPVALDQFLRPVAVVKQRHKKGKKKNRIPTPAPQTSTHQTLADPLPHPFDLMAEPETYEPTRHKSLTEYVQWLEIESAKANAHSPDDPDKPEPVAEVLDSAQTEEYPNILISSFTLGGQVDLFQGQRFEINAPGAQQVELLWRAVRDGTSQRVVMDHQRGDLFCALIGIQDGEYVFGYQVDGWIRPDARYAGRLVFRGDGVLAHLKLARQERVVVLHNRGKMEEVVWVESSVPWMALETEKRVAAGERVMVGARLIPQQMAPGLNEGFLRVQARRNGSELSVAATDISITAKAEGTIPEFQYAPREFGWIMQGAEQLHLSIEVEARGQGPLTGMVMLRHSEEVVDFQLDAASEHSSFSHTFVIDSANLPYRAQGALKVMLITDSYLANYRLCQAELPYSLIYLKKSLPALAYGQVRKGMTRTLRLEVERSDGKKVDLEASIPAQAAAYLEAYRARPNAYSFRLDTRELEPGTVITEVVTLLDRSSGLSDQIKVLAEVGRQQASKLFRAATE
jgi:hypothetical protein